MAIKKTKTREVPMGTMQRLAIEVLGLLKGVIPMCQHRFSSRKVA
jgi:hypothetical protein